MARDPLTAACFSLGDAQLFQTSDIDRKRQREEALFCEERVYEPQLRYSSEQDGGILQGNWANKKHKGSLHLPNKFLWEDQLSKECGTTVMTSLSYPNSSLDYGTGEVQLETKPEGVLKGEDSPADDRKSPILVDTGFMAHLRSNLNELRTDLARQAANQYWKGRENLMLRDDKEALVAQVTNFVSLLDSSRRALVQEVHTVAALKTEGDRLRIESDWWQKEGNRLRKEGDWLRSEKTRLMQMRDSFKAELEVSRKGLETASEINLRDVRERTQESERLRQELELKLQDERERVQEIGQLERRLEASEDESHQALQKRKEDSDQERQRARELEAKLAESQLRGETLVQQLHTVRKDLEEASLQADAAEQRLVAETVAKNVLVVRLKSSKAEVEKLKQEKGGVSEAHKARQKEVEEKSKALGTLQEHVKELEGQLESIGGKLGIKSSKRQDISLALIALQTSRNSARDGEKESDRKRRETEKRLEDQKEELQLTKEHLKKDGVKVKELKTRIEEERKKSVLLERDLKDANKEICQLKKQAASRLEEGEVDTRGEELELLKMQKEALEHSMQLEREQRENLEQAMQLKQAQREEMAQAMQVEREQRESLEQKVQLERYQRESLTQAIQSERKQREDLAQAVQAERDQIERTLQVEWARRESLEQMMQLEREERESLEQAMQLERAQKEDIKRTLQSERAKLVEDLELKQSQRQGQESEMQRERAKLVEELRLERAEKHGLQSQRARLDARMQLERDAQERARHLERTQWQEDTARRRDTEDELEKMQVEMTRLAEANLCLCLESDIDLAATPCGHCLCSACWETYTKLRTSKGMESDCPICRKKVVSVQPLYRPGLIQDGAVLA